MPPANDGHGSAARRLDGVRPVRRRMPADNDPMDADTVIPLGSIDSLAPVEDPYAADLEQAELHLVEPDRPEQPDHQQQRRAFQERCAEIADQLAITRRFEDRMELYRYGEFTWHELSTAAALYPELMPTLNGEWEWIALTLADNEGY